MSKRDKRKSKQRDKSRSSSNSPFGWFRPRQPDPALFASQAGALIERGKVDEALEFLEPLLDDYPRSPELFGTAAVAYATVGDFWTAITCFERVQKLSPEPVIWATLAGLYVQVGMNSYAIQAARNALKGMANTEDQMALHAILTPLEYEFNNLVQSLGIPAKQVETGLRHHDDAQRALGQNDYPAAINATRLAIRFLGNWPPAHNNLALALFYNGQGAEALTTARNVLARDPDNLHALSNAIRFLAWSGKTDEARTLWERLRLLEAKTATERMKQAEAAAIVEEDESVYQLLKPLVDAATRGEMSLNGQTILHLAIAEANTGRTKSAMKRLKELDESDPKIQAIYDALRAKRRGIGWTARFAYFSVAELMPLSSFADVALLMDQQDNLDERQFKKRVNKLLEQYPQLVLIGKKLIWEEQQPQLGIDLLGLLGTSEAYAVLREFGLSQVGEDQDRIHALLRLKETGQIDADQPVKMWNQGEWREVKLITYEISNEPEIVYPPAVIKIYERGVQAFHEERYAEAERLYKQVIALEPRAADAYFNLGTAYGAQGNIEQAKVMFHKAIELRPLYALPRCQLAHMLLNDDDVEGAKEMLLPLANATRLNELEATMYMYTQARILVAEEEYKQARALLESLLEVSPDFAPAQNLLDNVSLLAILGEGFKNRFADMQRRQGQRRIAMQTKLKTADVTTNMALSLFNREVQQSMARHITPRGRWSTLKKKQLHEYLVLELQGRDTLKSMLDALNKEERAALRAVIKRGGSMPWDEFDKKYGNDLDENPDWQYQEPTTLMGRLRQRALLAETTVNNQLLLVIPLELRQLLKELL